MSRASISPQQQIKVYRARASRHLAEAANAALTGEWDRVADERRWAKVCEARAKEYESQAKGAGRG